MKKYEGVFIFVPTLEEEARNEMLERIKTIITDNGSVDNVDEWGMRKLAYEINDIPEGYYVLVDFETEDAEIINEVDRICKISDNVLRHMIVKAKK